MLDLAKIEAGRVEVHPEPVAIGALVRECLATIEPQVQAKGLRLNAVGVDEAPPIVQDGGRVKQIVLNLLSNAVKFTPAGSIELRVTLEPGWVTVAVADTGVGIAPADQATIFDEFRQVDSRETQSADGSGLGLPISRRLADLLCGTLEVESVPGEGSVFTLRLPMSLVPATESGRAARAPNGSPTVLVIDDDKDVVDIVRDAAVDEPIGVEWAANSQEGLARARASRPHAILLDVILQSGDDGWETLRRLKADPETRDIPVLVHSVVNNAERAHHLGATRVLVKPVPTPVLRELLAELASAPAPGQREAPA